MALRAGSFTVTDEVSGGENRVQRPQHPRVSDGAHAAPAASSAATSHVLPSAAAPPPGSGTSKVGGLPNPLDLLSGKVPTSMPNRYIPPEGQIPWVFCVRLRIGALESLAAPGLPNRTVLQAKPHHVVAGLFP